MNLVPAANDGLGNLSETFTTIHLDVNYLDRTAMRATARSGVLVIQREISVP